MEDLIRIKKLASEVGEHSFFSITKRGVMWIVELIGWVSSVGLLFIGVYLFMYKPSLIVSLDEQHKGQFTADVAELNSFFHLLGFIVIVLSVLVLFITLYIKRARNRKAKVHQLTILIKALK